MQKEAAPLTTLSDDISKWSQELMTALLEKAPYLGNYQIDVSVLGHDEKLGYGYGFFKVYPAPSAPLGSPEMTPNTPAPPEKSLRVPFVVAKKKLKPVNVFVDPSNGKAYPLSQRRMQSILFSPTTFEASSVPSPMMNSGPAQTGGLMMPYDLSTKMASSKYPICAMLGQTVSPKVKKAFAHALVDDPELVHGLEHNDAFRGAIDSFLDAKSKTAAQIHQDVMKEMPVDSILIEKTANGYNFTSGCCHAYANDSKELVNGAEDVIPANLRKEADAKGYVVRAKTLPIYTEDASPDYIKTAGVYNVQTTNKEASPALVFTDVESLDGTPTDYSLVKTASGYSYMETPVGTPASSLHSSLAQEPWQDLPRGTGFFVKTSGAATMPVDIEFYEKSAGATYAVFETPTERGRMKISSQIPESPGLAKLGAGDYVIHPKTLTRFIKLGEPQNFCNEAELATKLANAATWEQKVDLVHNDGEFSISGAPVDALGDEGDFISEPKVAFVMGMLGVPPQVTKAKIAEAQTFGRTSMLGYRTLHRYEETREFSKQAAAKFIDKFPVRQGLQLVKCAMVVPDEKSVDAILGLNFVTPENVASFVDALPLVEEALSKLCELYLGIQLGLSDVPESAAGQSINSLEAVTAGLELLRLRNKETETPV